MQRDRKSHWNGVYCARTEAELSWTQPDPQLSLSLIAKLCPPNGKVIDVGGGDSVLVQRLADAGYAVTVLDLSSAALSRAAERMGRQASRVRWIEADVTRAPSDVGPFDLWHDRALFHFLAEASDRAGYRAFMERTVAAGKYAIIATFAPEGPDKCSGLDVRRYDPPTLATEIGTGFELIESVSETHRTPWGSAQPFQYSVFQRRAAPDR